MTWKAGDRRAIPISGRWIHFAPVRARPTSQALAPSPAAHAHPARLTGELPLCPRLLQLRQVRTWLQLPPRRRRQLASLSALAAILQPPPLKTKVGSTPKLRNGTRRWSRSR
jgi:hypothetical protein